MRWRWRRARCGGRLRPASCRATQTQSTPVPSAKIQASRMASPDLPASDGCAASSDTKSAGAPAADAGRPGAERLRAAGERRVEQRAAGRAARLPPARCAPRCESRCEYSSWRSSSATPISTLESEPMPKRPPCATKSGPRKSAVAEIGLGDRAEAGDRAARGHRRRLGVGHVGRVDQAPARVDRRRWPSSHSTGRAPDQARQSSTSFTCSAMWMWIGPAGA